MSTDTTQDIQAIIARRRVEVERAKTDDEKSEIWRLAAAEIRFKSFEMKWRKEGNRR